MVKVRALIKFKQIRLSFLFSLFLALCKRGCLNVWHFSWNFLFQSRDKTQESSINFSVRWRRAWVSPGKLLCRAGDQIPLSGGTHYDLYLTGLASVYIFSPHHGAQAQSCPVCPLSGAEINMKVLDCCHNKYSPHLTLSIYSSMFVEREALQTYLYFWAE